MRAALRSMRLTPCLALLAACGSDPGPAGGTPDGGAGAEVFALELSDREPALLAVAPLEPEGRRLVAVGGPFVGDGPPAVFLRDASGAWAEAAPPPGFRGAAWWAWAAAPDDLFVVGAGAQIARGAPGAMALLPIADPVRSATTATLYGVFGRSPTEVWMVGGGGRSDGPYLLAYDGAAVRRTPLTGDAAGLEGEVFYKVWGPPEPGGPIFVVGTGGLALRREAGVWTALPTGLTDRLLTVHGRSAGEVWAVGGDLSGVVLRGDGRSWTRVEAEGMPPLNGVFAAPDGRTWVCGATGYLAWHDEGGWHEVDTGVFGRDFHGVWAGPGGVFAAGGQLAVAPGPRRGLVGRFGP
jgi:hypothetical protein